MIDVNRFELSARIADPSRYQVLDSDIKDSYRAENVAWRRDLVCDATEPKIYEGYSSEYSQGEHR